MENIIEAVEAINSEGITELHVISGNKELVIKAFETIDGGDPEFFQDAWDLVSDNTLTLYFVDPNIDKKIDGVWHIGQSLVKPIGSRIYKV